MKTILFQGDSITDCGRDREDPNSLGNGYVKLVSELLPGCRVLNRGISGNRSRDLVARWQEDCLDLRPGIVSIHIGINDVWRGYDSNDPTSDESYEVNYRQLLEPLKHTPVLLIVPFLTNIDSPAVAPMRKDLAGKQAVVYQLAAEYGTALLDADALYLHAVEQGATPAALAHDGVHPTEMGHRLLAEAVAGKLRNRT